MNSTVELTGEGKDLLAIGTLRVAYNVEASYERLPGGLPEEDFTLLTGPLDGDQESEDDVDRIQVRAEPEQEV